MGDEVPTYQRSGFHALGSVKQDVILDMVIIIAYVALLYKFIITLICRKAVCFSQEAVFGKLFLQAV